MLSARDDSIELPDQSVWPVGSSLPIRSELGTPTCASSTIMTYREQNHGVDTKMVGKMVQSWLNDGKMTMVKSICHG